MQSITVAIPTYNGIDYIKELVDALNNQVGIQLETIICDSSSTDGTWEFLEQQGNIKSFQIPKSKFSHGETRQKLVELATHEIIVFLSQDALPFSKTWALDHWEAHQFLPDNVAAVLGNQVPRENCRAAIGQRIVRTFSSLGNNFAVSTFGSNSIMNRNFGSQPLRFLSDVHVSYKRQILLRQVPFEKVQYAEDQLMAKNLIQHGYEIAYIPQISVLHSNDVGILGYKQRIYDETVGLYTALNVPVPKISPKKHMKNFSLNLFHDFKFIFSRVRKRNLKYIIREALLAPIFEIQSIFGQNLAYRANKKIVNL